MSDLKPSQIVELKSGGPKMTVLFVIGAQDTNRALTITALNQGYANGDVMCEWFDGEDRKTHLFRASSLM